MDDILQATITTILTRIPEWLRHDLASKEQIVRTRAEETLAAMIANVLADSDR